MITFRTHFRDTSLGGSKLFMLEYEPSANDAVVLTSADKKIYLPVESIPQIMAALNAILEIYPFESRP